MANAIDIVTLAEAKAALNLPTAVGTYDPELEQVITAASVFVDGVFGPVVQRTITGERHPGGSGSFEPRYPPVASVTTITEYSGGVATVLTAESPTVAGTYLIQYGRLYRRSSWGYSYFSGQEVIVTYVAGRYANTAACEAWAKDACCQSLIQKWAARGLGSGVGVIGGDGERFGGTVPFSQRQLRVNLQHDYPQYALPPGGPA